MRYRVPPRLWSPSRFRSALSVAAAAALGTLPGIFVFAPPARADGDYTITISVEDGLAEGTSDSISQYINVMLSPAPDGPVTVHVHTEADGTATVDDDFLALDGDLTFDAADTAKQVAVPIMGDDVYEPGGETYSFVVDSPGHEVGEGTGPHEITIPDDDAAPTVASLTFGTVLDEGSAETGPHDVPFTVELSNPSSTPIILKVTGDDDTAVQPAGTVGGADYAVPDTVTIPGGKKSEDFAVTVIGDDIFEKDETAVVSVAPADGQSPVSGEASATLTITNDDHAPGVAVPALTQAEGTTMVLDALVIGETQEPIPWTASVFPAWVEAGRPAAFADFSASVVASGTIQPGDGHVDLGTVSLAEDQADEFAETFNVVVDLGDLNMNGYPSGNLQTIEDKDSDLPPLIVGSDPVTLKEGASFDVPYSLDFDDVPGNTATRTEKPVSASWTLSSVDATSGSDYSGETSGTLAFEPGSTAGSIHVTTEADADVETDETLSLELSDPQSAGGLVKNPVPITITNRVRPDFTVTSEVAATEGQADPATFTVTLTEPAAEDVHFDVSIADQSTAAGDYTPPPVELTIPAMSQTGEIEVPILDDEVYETTETATLTVVLDGEETGSTATLSIEDDDTAPTRLDVRTFDQEEGAHVELGADVSNAGQDSILWTAEVKPGTSGDPAEAGDFTTGDLVLSGSIEPGDDHIDLGAADLLVDQTDEFPETVDVVVKLGADGALGTFSATSTIEDASTELGPNVMAPDPARIVEGQSASLPVRLSFAGMPWNTATKTEKTVEVDYALNPETAEGTATEDVDYAGDTSGRLVFAPDHLQEPITFETVADDVEEGGETVVVDLSNLVNASGSNPSQTAATIVDSADLPTFGVSPEVQVTEGDDAYARVTVTLSAAAPGDVELDMSIGEGTADTDDFSAPDDGILTIPAGQRTATIDMSITDNEVYEATEDVAVTVRLLDEEADATGAEQTSKIIIADDESVPTITLNAAPGAEGDEIDVIATPSGPAQNDMLYDLTFTGATSGGANPAEADDYSVDDLETFGSIARGSAGPVSIHTIYLLDDAIDEPVETLTMTATNTTVEGVDPVVTTYTITDDPADLPPTVSVGDVSVQENAGVADVPVRLAFAGGNGATASEQPVTVAYRILPGTADTADYFATAEGSLTLPAGGRDAVIHIPIVDDIRVETSEYFQVQVLSAGPAGATVGAGTGTVTILENDRNLPVPSFAVTGDVLAAEGGTASFKVTLSAPAQEAVDFTVGMQPGTATPGGNDDGETDYTDPPRALRIPAGSTSATLDVPIRQDTVWEGDESARLSVELAAGELDAAGPAQQGQLTITDDETKPAITLNQTSAALMEGDTFELAGTITGVAQRDLTFDSPVVATSAENTDYDLTDDEVTIPGGTLSGSKVKLGSIHFNRDATDEDTETLRVSFGGNVLTFQVADDPADTPPAVTIGDAMVGESDGSAELAVSLTFSGGTKATERTITVPWATVGGTADAGKDYTTSSGQLTLTSLSSTGTIRVPVLADKRDEATQTFTVRLGAPSPAGVTLAKPDGKVTITDDDKPSAPTLTAPASIVGPGRVTLSGVAGANAQVELLRAVGTSGGSFREAMTTTADDDGVYRFTLTFALGYRVMTRANKLTSPVRTVSVKQDPTLVVVSSSKGTVTMAVRGDPDEPGQRVIIQRRVSGEWREVDTGELNRAGKYTTTLRSLKSGGTYVYRAVIASTPSIGVLSGASDPETVKVK
ncbi:Calx-beta domain-containing protein [Actinoplanes palleronii]|uniref:Fibronectin type-III domain-containing protein n=1 Tax=Actinoplanes palleronii TaxID=113570 RepID=A0ABQ4BF96_9ACTN|nr:Calx-beta domain-containing protein [Actinoplanes palleronii]GIE69350.1 hypothetical protein Apa02nite_054580 [Actinoplanes palleronii]